MSSPRTAAAPAPGTASAGDLRREKIVELLAASVSPLSGSALARACGVSRQVVVQDVALLRSRGVAVGSTSRGYVLETSAATGPSRSRRLVKCRHTVDETEAELTLVVDLGATVDDVLVNHRVYGLIRSELGISSRRDVERFMEAVRSGASEPLMQVTSGYHFHHVSADSKDVLDEVEQALGEAGFLTALTDYEREASAGWA